MDQIWKFPVPVLDEFVIEMPVGAKPLLVDIQNSEPFVWALVNPDAKKVNVKFQIHGTGHGIENADKLEYIGTFQQQSGKFVWHLFKVL